jgi:HD-GYP domain-containing protein (c-di-GMP phosphodiesterase class II)
MVNIRETMAAEKITEAVDTLVQPGMSNNFIKKLENISALPQVFTQVIKMTELTLNAAAASILLFRDNDQELYFEGASGPVGRTLRQVKLNTQYGIAGQVARTGKPLIVNDVTRSKNFHKMIDDTTGFATQSLVCAPLSVNKKILGVIEVLNKRDGTSFNERDLEAVVSVANTAAMAIENTRLYQSTMEAYRNTILAAGLAIDSKGPYQKGHSQRVMEYALKAGAVLSFSPEEIETLEFAGLLHDLGKIMIDTPILNKTDELTPKEWEIVRAHPVKGAEMMSGVPLLANARILVMYHHERYDGRGYPEGLKGEAIPIGARIISVANEFDAMTIESSFRNAMSIEDAVKELRENSGTQFCPVAVKALITGLRLNTGKSNETAL